MKVPKLFLSTLMMSAALLLAACNKDTANSEIKPPEVMASRTGERLCAFSNDEEAKKCRSGDVAIWLPQRWGNEQLAPITAAKYCDFDKSIALTNGAVSCVFYSGRTVANTNDPSAAEKEK